MTCSCVRRWRAKRYRLGAIRCTVGIAGFEVVIVLPVNVRQSLRQARQKVGLEGLPLRSSRSGPSLGRSVSFRGSVRA